ncbi:PRC-barrel domain-containing protein [Loktanella sp. M215]|uniref:PRC-barrel domain-containing protein n=1 Tax=Loktanella sp. M215 TaxID=2675431 RepID=UPI001F47E163|nr:PRC-barrel domain-containing protein [Loktanella sp. M215]MCF7701399.1 hypothetical protein [Loktanella sp. M215]
MKTILASTAIALVMANAAVAQTPATSPATDGTSTDSMSVQSTGNPAPTSAMPATDGTSTDSMSVTSTGTGTSTEVVPADSSTSASEAPATDGTSNDSMSVQNAASAMTMDGYSDVVVTEITVEQLTGLDVYDTDGNKVGTISEPVIGADGTVSAAIVDVGGFLGLGAKPVAISLSSMQVLAMADGSDMRAYVGMTTDQLKEMPAYEATAASN